MCCVTRCDVFNFHVNPPNNAPQDTLSETSELVTAALGREHAVAKMVAELARANVSSARRAALLEQERLQQVWPPRDGRHACSIRACQRGWGLTLRTCCA